MRKLDFLPCLLVPETAENIQKILCSFLFLIKQLFTFYTFGFHKQREGDILN